MVRWMAKVTAVGIARQSRGDDASQSVESQTGRIRAHCERQGWTLSQVHEERDVSGGRALAKRPGLLAAVEAVEAGKASVIVVAYFDRLVRSMSVQLEVVERVEAAGGRIVAVDFGDVSHATATGELTSGFLGQVAQYHRSATRERVAAAHEALIAQGKWCGGRTVPFGYRKDEDGKLEVVPAAAKLVRETFKMRKRGDSLEMIREHLRAETGAPWKSLNMVQRILRNRVYLGELRHGKLVNERAHDAIVDASLFRRVQEHRIPRGKRPSSDRLLARLGVLKCAECRGRLNVHGSRSNQTYRCHNAHFAVSCHIAEAVVVHEVRKALSEHEGRAGGNLEALENAVQTKRAALGGIVRALDGLGDVDVARERIAVAKGELENAEDELARAREAAVFTLHGGLHFPEMGADTQRELIHAVVDEALVGPGRGAGRVRVTLSANFAPEPILDDEARVVREDLRLLAKAI
jgi:site-specific DNA recombinase